MAPVGDKSEIPGSFDEKNDVQDEQNIWSTILQEVQTSSSTKLPSTKSLLVLGDNESGKTTLIAKLKGAADPKKGAGMEYFYIDVRDEYREDHTRLGVYILDGEASYSHLLKFALSERNVENVTVMFCASMTQPWLLMDSLNTWATILHDHFDRLMIPFDQKKELKQRVIKRWQDYIEPGDELEAGAAQLRRAPTASGSVDDDSPALPLPENVLNVNLGVDIVVAITKTDFMSNLEKEHDYKDEHFDFIQQSIRKFCLQYGATLFYTSVKEDKNCDLLYKYLVHRIYNFPFHTPALVVEKDAVFIPSGWDNEKKIAILHENMTTMRPDDFFSDVIVKPVIRRPVQRDIEIQAEDEQVFLTKQQGLLNQQTPTQGTTRPPSEDSSPIRSPGVHKTPDRRLSGSPGVQPTTLGTPKKMDGAKGNAGTSEGVLANFFNSLLSKKTGAGQQSGAMKTTDKATVRSDAAAELDRMTRSRKPNPTSPSTPNSNSSSS